jgi:endo-1,4-beta-D-glucanase Y
MSSRRKGSDTFRFGKALFVALLSVPALVPVQALAGEGGAYSTGIYTDAFAGLLGKSAPEVRAKLDTAFNRLFFGDDGTGRVFYPVGHAMGYIEDIANNDVRTEGMSYGMMIAVQMNRKDVFDRLWTWAKTNMQFTDGAHRGYFGWHCRPDGTVMDSTAASDGEEWFVTSLFFAAARWGDCGGIYDYRREAQDILTTMLHKESEPGHGTVTNAFNRKEHLVAFVPSASANQFTDPSYQLPHFYELWSRWAGRDNGFWRDAASAGRRLLRAAADTVTGLSPDYARFDGTPWDPKGKWHDQFRFDAWRVAMNVAVDWLWFQKDRWDIVQSDRLLGFFSSEGIRQYGNQYTLGGKKLAADHSTGLVAANAVAALAARRPDRKEFIEALWNVPVPSGRYRYYDGMLYMLGLLEVSGNFRIYDPTGESSAIEPSVGFTKGENGFPLSASGKSAPLCVSSRDYPGVIRAVSLFQNDVGSVTGARPPVVRDSVPHAREIVLIGTLGKNPLIDGLVDGKKLDVRGIAGQWETSLVQTVEHPFPGVDRALVIAGSDKRGTIFGMFGISGRIGVSPWYWWGDVPVRHHNALFVRPGRHSDGPPSVKYRGIFLNDEMHDLTKWVNATYGGVPEGKDPPVPAGVAMYGHRFYERVFELLLRLKANYLWPAMWNNAFNEDDPENPKLADEYGIVMGTSHQEPMLRAQKEWDRRYLRTLGTWNYATHADALETFWREGIRRNRSYESIITMGLRGANDTPMAPGGPEANMALLERIVGVERTILAQEMNRDVTQVPQAWCLYKEVLEFYNAGMRVPDDVTLLWPDDNWGNIRRLPTAEERNRGGGAGIYYHFDYHGGPRSYQWINANPLPKIWDQMSLAIQYGADRIWIVNVGHLKGYEFPIEYFMSLAWNAKRWTGGNAGEFARHWAEREFGAASAPAIADLVSTYSLYNGRRKPELLEPATYSLTNYNEAERVVMDFKGVASRADSVYRTLPQGTRDAFYELLLFPSRASALVNELYMYAGMNALYARQGRSATNETAAKVRSLFAADTALMGEFNRKLAGGKWNHFMDQPHLGYTGWQDPPENSLRAIPLREITTPVHGALGVAVEGSDSSWPGPGADPSLPPFDRFNRQSRTIEIFNRGRSPYDFGARADRPWINISLHKGVVRTQERLIVTVNWQRIPRGNSSGSVRITGPGGNVDVRVNVRDPGNVDTSAFYGFLEGEGVVSMEAGHFTANTGHGLSRWIGIEGYGHTLSGMRCTSPVDAPPSIPGSTSACLEYRMYLPDTGNVAVDGIFGPTLNFLPGRGLRYALSFDDESPQVITLVPEVYAAGDRNEDWARTVEDNARHSLSAHRIASPGVHTLKFWSVDPGVVLEKIVVDCGGRKQSYLGPPESFHRLPAGPSGIE